MTPPQQKIARLARGERSMFAVGVLVCLTLFGIAGLITASFNLVFLGVFVWLAAAAEAAPFGRRW